MTSPSTQNAAAKVRHQLIEHLRELVAALDKRIPQIEREGEPLIARDSAALKKQAQERIAQLEARE